MAGIKTESAGAVRSGCAVAMGVLSLVLTFAAAGALAQERVLVADQVGECRFTVEADDQWHALRLRALHPQHKNCRIDRESMLRVIGSALSGDVAAKADGLYSSLFIGRIIDYPWLSHYLATAARHDQGWDSKRGRPRSGDINRYVSALLSRRELLARLMPAFSDSGYEITGVSVEKVLVGTFRDVPDYSGAVQAGRVPFDAMLWLRLARSSR